MAKKRSRETEDNLESSPGQQHNKPDDSSQPSTSKPQMQTRLQTKRLRILAKMAPPPGLRITGTNDDALRLILEELSLQELIPLRIICKWWKAIIEQICNGKRSLKLFSGRASIREYYKKTQALLPHEPALQLSPAGKFNDDLVLNPKKLNSEKRNDASNKQRNLASQFIVDLFPSITSLVIAVKVSFYKGYGDNIYQSFAKYDFTYLLSQWPGLETLAFVNFPISSIGIVTACHSSPRLAELERTYWTAISELTFLKHLFILGNVRENKQYRYWPVQNEAFSPAELTLSRLQQFTYQNSILQLVVPYYVAQLKNCTKLNLSVRSDFFQLKQFYQMKPRTFNYQMYHQMLATMTVNLAANLTHLELNFKKKKLDYLEFICDHLTELTVLRDSIQDSNHSVMPSWRFKPTVRQLSKLTKLTELRIAFKARNFLVPLHGNLPALHSVKILRMNITGKRRHDVVSSTPSCQIFQQVFPGLEEVHVSCFNKALLDEARNCFTSTQFPALKSFHFYDDPKKMERPSAVQFMGEHAYYL